MIGDKQFVRLPHCFHNETIGERFYVSDTVLSGKFGAVYKGVDLSVEPNVPVLIKCIDITEIKSECSEGQANIKLKIVQREVEIMNKKIDQKILPCIKYYQSDEYCIIVTQYCNEGTLNDITQLNGSVELDRAINILKQVSAALSALHNAQIMHTCLALHSIYVHLGKCYIGDIGATNVILGTDQKAEEFYKFDVDLYSLGLILFQMLCPEGNLRERINKARSLDLDNISFKLKNGLQVPSEVKLFLKQSLSRKLTWKKLSHHELFHRQKQRQVPCVYIRSENKIFRQTLLVNLDQEQELMDLKFKHTDQIELSEYQKPVFNRFSSCTSALLCSTEYSDEQTEKYNRVRRMHLKKNICEYIHAQIIKEIQRIKPFSLTRTKSIELMYMLSSRCFIEMTFLNFEFNHLLKQHPDDQELKNLKNQHDKHYKKYDDLFQSYSNKLTQKEDKFKNIFLDFFRKVFFPGYMEQKNRIMNGEESTNDEQKRNKHIQWIQNQLKNSIKSCTKTQETKNLYRKFMIFEKLAKLTLKDMGDKQFQQVVKNLISKA